ncbi:MAG: DUF1015 domain-containing protein [Candidatus Methanomethylophilaceae archaeon]
MVKFLPFTGYRPVLQDGEKIVDRISPPYDVIDDDYLQELQSHPYNVTRITLMPTDGRYHTAAAEWRRWRQEGRLKSDPAPSYYLYQQTFSTPSGVRTRTGIVGVLKTEPYEDGNVIPHEETFSKVKEDRLNLLRDTSLHSESIFGIFPGLGADLNERLQAQAQEVYEHQDADGVQHRYLAVNHPDLVKEVQDALEGQKMLIADGHHRYETALAYSLENLGEERKGYVLATLVAADDPGLVIWPTHRLVKVDGYHETSFLNYLNKTFQVQECPRDELTGKLPGHDLALLTRSGKTLLLRYEDRSDPLWTLDTYIAQEKILKGQLGYEEGKAKVSFDAELHSVLKKMAKGGYDLAIVFNPPSLEKVWELSLMGKRMPKKSTYFFPKIWSGFVYYRM